MADDENETILSLLCNKTWTYDPRWTYTLKFHENGVGEIIFFDELSPFICAEFDWQPTSPSSLSQPLTHSSTQFTIQMTLTTRRIPKIGTMSTANWTINEGSLHETAFLPREHSVRLERGTFMPKEHGNHFSERHRLRLVFDPAPLPGKEHWRYKPAAEALRFWERDTFYAGQVAQGEGEGQGVLGDEDGADEPVGS